MLHMQFLKEERFSFIGKLRNILGVNIKDLLVAL